MDENVPPQGNPVSPEPAPPPVNAPPPVTTSPPIAPPVIAAAAAGTRPQRRGGRGWMVLAIILLVLLGISMLYNLSSFANAVFRGGGSKRYMARVAGPRLDEVVREDNGVSSKILIVPLNGIIMGGALDQGGFGMVEIIKAQLKQAEEDDRVKAVILKVDSPGGEVLAADEINRAIAEFEKNTRKPVVSYMGTVAASGGYYVSAPCRWIIANELTITGSIGVIMSSYNYRGLMDKVGVMPMVYKSGKFKDMMSGSREPESITPEETAMIQGLIDETFGKFKSVVRDGRGQAHEKNKQNRGEKDQGKELVSDWESYADGRVLSGTEAAKLGFVDELGGFKDAVSRTKKLAGVSEANLVEYQQRFELADFFRFLGKSDSKSLKIDLGMQVPHLEAGHLYFLAPTFVH